MTLEEEVVRAAREDDAERLKELLDGDPALARTPTRDGSLLLTAAYHGARNALRVLLDRGPELDLFEAAVVGDVARIRETLRRTPEIVETPNRDGYTALGLAAFFGQKDAVQALVEGGAPVDQVMTSREGNTALDAAVAGNHLETAQVLLEAGARTNVRSRGGLTPLHKAAFSGDADMARLLLAHGADPGATTEEGRTPLDVAQERGHLPVVDVLREG